MYVSDSQKSQKDPVSLEELHVHTQYYTFGHSRPAAPGWLGFR